MKLEDFRMNGVAASITDHSCELGLLTDASVTERFAESECKWLR